MKQFHACVSWAGAIDWQHRAEQLGLTAAMATAAFAALYMMKLV